MIKEIFVKDKNIYFLRLKDSFRAKRAIIQVETRLNNLVQVIRFLKVKNGINTILSLLKIRFLRIYTILISIFLLFNIYLNNYYVLFIYIKYLEDKKYQK